MPLLPLLLPLKSLIEWALNNARWLVPALAIAFAGVYGYHRGGEAVQSEWDLSAALAREAAAAALELDHKAANAHADALEKTLAAQRANMNKLKGRLAHEIAQNSIYNTCVVPPDGVHLLNESRAAH